MLHELLARLSDEIAPFSAFLLTHGCKSIYLPYSANLSPSRHFKEIRCLISVQNQNKMLSHELATREEIAEKRSPEGTPQSWWYICISEARVPSRVFVESPEKHPRRYFWCPVPRLCSELCSEMRYAQRVVQLAGTEDYLADRTRRQRYNFEKTAKNMLDVQQYSDRLMKDFIRKGLSKTRK